LQLFSFIGRENPTKSREVNKDGVNNTWQTQNKREKTILFSSKFIDAQSQQKGITHGCGRCDTRIMVRSILSSKGAISVRDSGFIGAQRLVDVAPIQCGGATFSSHFHSS